MKKKFRKISKIPEFEKKFKKLHKKYRTLDNDLDTFINTQLYLYHKLDIDNEGIQHIPDLGFSDPKIYKATKFACRSLKGKGVRSGIRVIYTYYDSRDEIELIEIYYKSDQKVEDRALLKRLYNVSEE